MGETFTHYARRVEAVHQHNRLTVAQARAGIRPLLTKTEKAADDPR